ncbi:MAG: HWE histidine kinase domain-containing protein [Caulobacter sp.]|nr:HWE histidine kinase domain-containing protein [Caulobacter sp.]
MPEEVEKSEEQEGAEAEVDGHRQDLGPFVVAAEATRMPMVFTNAKEPGNKIIFANDSFLALTGYAREEVLGQGFDFLLAQDTDPKVRSRVAAAFAGQSEDLLELQYRRKDGSPFWAVVFISPVRDDAGDIGQHFASLADLTRHRQEEDHLRFLLDELNHRTQNTLATVLAIAGQTLRTATDRDQVDAFEGRILALSRAHSLLGRQDWLAVSLRDVIERILQPFGLGDDGDSRFLVKGVDVRLEPKMALSLAMVFHELATNAAKYGALSKAGAGRVEISWEVDPGAQTDRMRLRWQEAGGPPVTPPGRSGFGSRLIAKGLAQELGAEVKLDFDVAGVICTIAMPVPRMAGR